MKESDRLKAEVLILITKKYGKGMANLVTVEDAIDKTLELCQNKQDTLINNLHIAYQKKVVEYEQRLKKLEAEVPLIEAKHFVRGVQAERSRLREEITRIFKLHGWNVELKEVLELLEAKQ